MNPEFKLLGISQKTYDFVKSCENSLGNIYEGIEANEAYTQARVLKAFQDNCIALRHFAPTSGYGYDDIGREALGAVFACALEAEDALVRPQISSGTQAIFTALSGLLEPGDVMLSLTGKPYDTLEKAIGISGDEYCSLKRMGVIYRQVDLTADGHIDIDAAKAAITGSEKVIYFQRSRGYSWRNALTPEEMAPVFDMAKKLAPGAFIVVDNCYGEFTRPHEPAYYGADVMIGSLIKNIGSGIAPTGGYIAGYVVAALAAGIVAERFGRKTIPVIIGCVIGLAACYTIGTVWYCFQSATPFGAALSLCVLPFLPGDTIKIAAAALIVPRLYKAVYKA